jgi:hypothetical protein
MSDSDTQFDIDDDGELFVTVADQTTVYESYDAAVSEVSEKLSQSENALVAKVNISGDGDDVEMNLEQVDWETIIQDMNDL